MLLKVNFGGIVGISKQANFSLGSGRVQACSWLLLPAKLSLRWRSPDSLMSASDTCVPPPPLRIERLALSVSGLGARGDKEAAQAWRLSIQELILCGPAAILFYEFCQSRRARPCVLSGPLSLLAKRMRD